MITKVKGLVLSNSDYKENDLLCHILTKEYGMITLIAKGAKKTTAKNRGCTQCYVEAEFIFDFVETKRIFNLIRANFIKNYYCNSNLEIVSALNLLCEITTKYMNSTLDNKNLYELLNNIMNVIYDYPTYTLVSIYILKILKFMGHEPYVDGCVICNETKVISFSIANGGFLCHKHSNFYEVMDVKILKNIRLLNKIEIKYLHLLKEDNYSKECFEIITEFFLVHSEIKLKSYAFYKSLL